ncbi:MAG TPA: superinfection immunity protein [Baekduia sp.]|nr:superinfection immunity protein [Baekduia sp.]
MVLTQPILPTLHDLPLLAAIALVVCLAPSIVLATAARRRSRAMLVINLLRGWTLVGWAACLATALYRMPSRRRKTRGS